MPLLPRAAAPPPARRPGPQRRRPRSGVRTTLMPPSGLSRKVWYPSGAWALPEEFSDVRDRRSGGPGSREGKSSQRPGFEVVERAPGVGAPPGRAREPGMCGACEVGIDRAGANGFASRSGAYAGPCNKRPGALRTCNQSLPMVTPWRATQSRHLRGRRWPHRHACAPGACGRSRSGAPSSLARAQGRSRTSGAPYSHGSPGIGGHGSH